MTRPVSVIAALCLVGLGSTAIAGSATPLPGIRSPSGNITCFVIPAGRAPATLLCNLAQADYAARLQARCMEPNGSGVDWHGFTLTAKGRGTSNCSGGILYNPATQRPSYVTLAYGKSWRQRTFTCWSRVTGVTCRNRAGHGLFVSRQSWRLW
jgi:hypothetical protein